MKKMKILTINFDLKFDTLYVFHLKRNCSYQVNAKNAFFIIKTDQFGFAMFCFDVNKIRKTDENNLLRVLVITEDCKSVSITVFNDLMQKEITSFLLNKIKKANVNRTIAIVNSNSSVNNSKSVVNTHARNKSKKNVNKISFRSLVLEIALRLVKTKSRLFKSSKIENFSYKELQKIYSKRFNKICSYLTKDMLVVSVRMKNSIFTKLNQSNITKATA